MKPAKTPYRWITGILGLAVVSSGCASLSKGEVALDLGIKDRGVASWYGKEFHGRMAANGEIFDMAALTAAHRKLPLGTLVRVVNLVNGKQVDVRINDRGPYVTGRILDLSYAAAAELGMVEAGTSVVHLEVVGQHRPIASGTQARYAMTLGRGLLTGGIPGVGPEPYGPVLELQVPPPAERLFPRDILRQRRERRHAAVATGEYPAHTFHS
ncbi:MAG TPA: septal ring lytic transglycosylase RlpA family protein [Nitrospiraceae bacterium]|nr:septal ring lytic transglycosylase RlpA family protein [Nitrospiraceae bacterium]